MGDVGDKEKDELANAGEAELVIGIKDFLTSLATYDTSLLTAFNKLVDALNNRQWKTVGDLCDDNVTLTTLDKPKTYRHKQPVIEYIKTKIAKDHPTLSPITVNPDSTTGIVDGEAWWYDNDYGVPTKGHIYYKFIFVLHSDDIWYAVNLFGTPD
jgi:hypothetical protein